MDRFIDTVYAMRQALAELEPYYTVAWDSDRFMLTEPELINLARELREARRACSRLGRRSGPKAGAAPGAECSRGLSEKRKL